MADKITQIPAPRVPFVDANTGLVNREWYRFLYNLYNITGAGTSDISNVDLALAPVAQPSFEVQTQVISDAVDTLPQPQLGTFAGLEQANLPWTTFNRNPGPYPSTIPGTVYWNNEDRAKTLAIVMEDSGDIVQDVGEEAFYRVKASSAITKGQVVMFTGAVGASGGLEAAPATGLTAAQAEYIMGVATQNIANNGWGYVTWFGKIKGIDTRGLSEGGWIDGQVLYYDPTVTGGLTKTRPSPPNPIVVVAAVVYAASNGILFVRPTYSQNTGAVFNSPPVTKTADFTVADTETWIINNKSGSSCTATLPVASTNTGRLLHFINHQGQTLVSASSNVVPQNGGSAGTAILAATAGDWATLISDGTNWVIMQAAKYNNLLLE
jgi:hypothetical protein